MKTANRFLAMLLAVVMISTMAVSVSAFDDVTVESDYYTAVTTLSALGVIEGKSETTFAPDDLVTREQMAALVYRLYTTFSNEGGENLTTFTDMDDAFYNTMISWCYGEKVINGTSATTFEPKANIKYQDALTMVSRLLGYTDLSYPLGYITKARSIGLTEDLEAVAFDKELTRGEVAIILYNALEADGKEEIKETVYLENYAVASTRQFTLAVDVYDFQKTNYWIVGTDNFCYGTYNKSGDENSYNLIKLDSKNKPTGTEIEKNFEELGIDESVNSDDGILGYLQVMSKGALDDKDAIVLGSIITSNLDTKAELAVVYEEEDPDTTEKESENPVPEKISINGKKVSVNDYVYTISGTGVIAPVAAGKTLADEYPVFLSGNGKYVAQTIDLDNDDKTDKVIMFEESLKYLKDIKSDGDYVITEADETGSITKDKDVIVLDTTCAEEDYILIYQKGAFTHIAEVLTPIETTINKQTGTDAAAKYTLANGDVVGVAKLNNPVVGLDREEDEYPTASSDEQTIIVINGKIVFSSNTSTLSYTPYDYAFIISQAQPETSVDEDTAEVETVNNFIAFVDGKSITIPLAEDYAKGKDQNGNTIDLYPSWDKTVATIKDIEDGKYVLGQGIQSKDDETHVDNELVVPAGAEWVYDTTSKLYTLGDYYVKLDENSELFVAKYATDESGNNTTYESVKRYTMANMPTSAKGNIKFNAILRMPESGTKIYTLVVAYLDNGASFGTSSEYTANRIVLSSGTEIIEGSKYYSYEVLNVISGTIESVTDEYKTSSSVLYAVGSVIRKNSNGSISLAKDDSSTTNSSLPKAVFNDNGTYTNYGIAYVPENGVYDNRLITISGFGRQYNIGSTKVVKLTINDSDEYEVELADVEDLEDSYIRTFTNDSNDWKLLYAVILPDDAAWRTMVAADPDSQS